MVNEKEGEGRVMYNRFRLSPSLHRQFHLSFSVYFFVFKDNGTNKRPLTANPNAESVILQNWFDIKIVTKIKTDW